MTRQYTTISGVKKPLEWGLDYTVVEKISWAMKQYVTDAVWKIIASLVCVDYESISIQVEGKLYTIEVWIDTLNLDDRVYNSCDRWYLIYVKWNPEISKNFQWMRNNSRLKEKSIADFRDFLINWMHWLQNSDQGSIFRPLLSKVVSN
jgi:hypothetical protein